MLNIILKQIYSQKKCQRISPACYNCINWGNDIERLIDIFYFKYTKKCKKHNCYIDKIMYCIDHKRSLIFNKK